MKSKIQRAVISVVIFAVIYILSDFIIGWHSYDMYLKAIEFLAAIIGAGCFCNGGVGKLYDLQQWYPQGCYG